MALNITAKIFDVTDSQTVGGTTNSVSQAGTQKKAGRVTVQSSEVDINHSSDISSPGWVVCKNRGSTDRIDIGFATATYDMSLEPGDQCTFKIISTGAARLFVKAEASNDSNNFDYAFHEL